MPNPDKVRDVPSHTVKNYSKVIVYIDVIHVNGIMFLVGVSKHIGLIQCICIRKRTQEKFLHDILVMICEYQARGIFDVIIIGADKAFDTIESKLKDEPYSVTLTTCDANCHVEYVERMIRFVKEQIRALRLAMPYKIGHLFCHEQNRNFVNGNNYGYQKCIKVEYQIALPF